MRCGDSSKFLMLATLRTTMLGQQARQSLNTAVVGRRPRGTSTDLHRAVPADLILVGTQ